MDIAALSTSMHQAFFFQQVSISVTKMSMDAAKISGEALTKMMEQSVNPNLGQNVDIKL